MVRSVGTDARVLWAGLMAACVALAGCVDSGLPGKNLPLEEAHAKPFRYSTYDASADLPVAHMDGRAWRPAGPPEFVPASMLQPAMASGVSAAFTLRTDAAPIDRLYVPSGDRYVPYALVDGGRTTGSTESHEGH
jgi:hypothetical protein